MPGPLAPIRRPSRNITARSYSFTIRIEADRMIKTNNNKMIARIIGVKEGISETN